MTYEVHIRIDIKDGNVIGANECLAMDLEKYGDVTVISVKEVQPEQLRMGGVQNQNA